MINPGSATGAPALLPRAAAGEGGAAAPAPPPPPSFVLLDLDGRRCEVYSYSLAAGGEVKVDKIEFFKPLEGAGPSI